MENNEQMNVEEQKAEQVEQAEAKAEPTEKLYTKAEMDAYTDEVLNDKFAKWQKKQEKKVEEAKKLAEMNAEEKAKYERDELQKELDALKAEHNRNEMLKTARQMLSNDGVDAGDDLIASIIKDDAEATNLAVKELARMYKRDVEKGVLNKLGAGEPKKGGASALTKEEIFAIKDDKKRLKAIEENYELFKKGK